MELTGLLQFEADKCQSKRSLRGVHEVEDEEGLPAPACALQWV